MILPLGEYGTLSAGATETASFDETDVFLAQILATATEATLERVEYFSELEHQRDELQRQNERPEEFTSVVSHDIRNPLMVLSGAVEMAQETGEREHFERSQRAIDRMETMVDDLLNLARQGATIDDELEPVDLEAVSLDCWQTVGPEAANIVLEDDPTIMADRDRVVHLFENLFRNSVEHSGPDVTVRVGSLEDGFYVEDDGPGIDPDIRDRVFESGFSTSADNTGFGLAIVKRIAEAHGWTPDVTGSSDDGTRFRFGGVDFT